MATQGKDGIAWTEETWNPIRGCSKVSDGCRSCYAMGQAHRFSGPGQPYEGLTKMTSHGPVWTGDVRLVPEILDQPLYWKRPRLVFVNSMSDLFHEDVPFDFLDRVFAVMALARQHTFQVLTKRPERQLRYFSDPPGTLLSQTVEARVGRRAMEIARARGENVDDPNWDTWWEWPLRNVWLGVSAEDQSTADHRIRLLMRIKAAVRWLSAEPLLGPILIDPTMMEHYGPGRDRGDRGLDWVVVGGESGPKARPMHPDWARSLRDQCVAARVPFFFKQWGEYFPYALDMQDGDTWPWRIGPDGKRRVALTEALEQRDSWPALRMLRVGKRAAGRTLDGRTHDEYPEVP